AAGTRADDADVAVEVRCRRGLDATRSRSRGRPERARIPDPLLHIGMRVEGEERAFPKTVKRGPPHCEPAVAPRAEDGFAPRSRQTCEPPKREQRQQQPQVSLFDRRTQTRKVEHL